MTVRGSYVYFIATADRSMVKIGLSYFPTTRLEALQALSPLPLEIIATAPGGPYDERAVHTALIEHWSHREWFRGHADVIGMAAQVASSGVLPVQGARGLPKPFPTRKYGPPSPETRAKISAGILESRRRTLSPQKAA